MPRRIFTLALALLSLTAVALWAGEKGSRELAKGREGLARQDYQAAVEHLTAALGDLDPGAQKEETADAWLQLGLVQLTGLGRPEEALAGFLKSAELAANPASAWLWASVAAEKLGRGEDAGTYKARALAPPPAPAATAPAEPPAQVAPQAVETPAAAPEPAKEKGKGAAFEHFFSKAATKPSEKDKKAEAEPAAEQDTKKKVSAFDHFFGEKKKEEKEDKSEEPAEQKPPI